MIWAYRSQGVKCGGLNEAQMSECLVPVGDAICSLGGLTLLEEVEYWVDFESS